MENLNQPQTRREIAPAVKFIFVVALILGVIFGGKWAYNKYFAKIKESKTLAKFDLPTAPANAAASVAPFVQPSEEPAMLNTPQVRFAVMEWNSQFGLMFANGGPVTTKGSIMEANKVNLKLIRQDDCFQGLQGLVTFAQAYKKDPNTTEGYNFYAIMGDAAGGLVTPYYEQLIKLGDEFQPIIIGSAGKSFGEDAFMAPVSVRENAQNAKGLLVAAVIRDGDWNIVCKWAADNGILINPDDKVYNPNAINFVNATTYLEAANMYVTGAKVGLWVVDDKGVKTTEKRFVPVSAVTTWTPGDVNIASLRGGLVRIASTKEYASQMPNTIITIKKFAYDHPELIVNMLDGIFKGSDQVKSYSAAVEAAGNISAKVYKDQDGAYWTKYYKGVTESDKQGLMVELGGSAVHNLADNQLLYGLSGGSNIYADVYKVFGDLIVDMYPELLPSYPSIDKILDVSFIQKVAAKTKNISAATVQQFDPNAKTTQVVGKRDWTIEFVSGSAEFTSSAIDQLQKLKRDLTVSGGLRFEIHGYTDNTGDPESNVRLSQHRADNVKAWLESQDPVNFKNRIKVIAHGQEDAKADNSTAWGRKQNRRVQILQVK
ncbi:MAG: OmpA family protein [Candidatus Absconditabacteria bacterium]